MTKTRLSAQGTPLPGRSGQLDALDALLRQQGAGGAPVNSFGMVGATVASVGASVVGSLAADAIINAASREPVTDPATGTLVGGGATTAGDVFRSGDIPNLDSIEGPALEFARELAQAMIALTAPGITAKQIRLHTKGIPLKTFRDALKVMNAADKISRALGDTDFYSLERSLFQKIIRARATKATTKKRCPKGSRKNACGKCKKKTCTCRTRTVRRKSPAKKRTAKRTTRKHTHRVTHTHAKKKRGTGKGSHSIVRARGLLKAIAANHTMSAATKKKARATVKRKHPGLR